MAGEPMTVAVAVENECFWFFRIKGSDETRSAEKKIQVSHLVKVLAQRLSVFARRS